MSLQLRRGTNAERIRIVFAVGEIVYATDTKQIFVGDGTTTGGVEISPSRETIDYLENSAQYLDSGLESRVLNIVDQDYINEKARNSVSAGENLLYDSATGVFSSLVDSAFITAIVNEDYLNTFLNHDSDYIRSKIDQAFIDTFDTHDSGAIRAMIDIAVAANDQLDSAAIAYQIYNTVTQTFIDQFNTHDSLAVEGQINSAFSAKSTTDLSEGDNLYYTTARVNTDVEAQVNSSYVQTRVSRSFIEGNITQGLIDTFDTHDSAAIQGQIDVAIATIDLSDAGLDSAAVLALVSATDTHDSAAVQGQINATVNQSFIDQFDTHDSAAVLAQINARVTQSFIDTFDTHDSSAVQGQIDATIAATDTHDSAAVLGQITATVDAAYVQARQLTYDFLDSSEALALINATHVRGKIDQAFIDTFDTHDSAAVLAQINATVNQSFIDTFDTHDSAAVSGQITSTVTESYVKNFADSAHVRSALSGGTGVTFNGSTCEISIGQDVGTSDNVSFANVNISGDLNVTGTQTTVTSETLAINDPLIRLAESNEQSDILDIGFIGHYYGNGSRRHTGFFRDASNKEYYIFNGLIDSAFDSVPATNIVDRTKPGFTLATLNTGRIVGVYAGFDSDLATKTTSDLDEGTNLYYTDARVGTYVNTAYVQGKIDQSFINTFYTHDSAAVQGQIDSSATAYTLDFITTNGNTTTNNIEVGTINTLQVNNGNGDDAFSTAVGVDALVNVNSGTLRNTAFGRDALEDNTSGERNTAVGQGALANATTGSYNTAIGQGVMGSGIVTGNFNTAIGITALNKITTGPFNTAIGSQSPLGNTTTGQSNVAIGPYSLINNEEGSYNVAVGRSALAGNSLGNYTGNIAIGANALDKLEPGQNNHTVIGFRAGRDLDSGTRNTIIGFDAEASATFVNDEITLGDDFNKSFRIPGSQFYINGGSEGTTGSRVGIGTTSPSKKLHVVGEVQIDSDVTLGGDVFIGDNQTINIGASNDLQIYHDGTNSYISEQGTGSLKLLTSFFTVKNSLDTKQFLNATNNGAVKLFYDNDLKIETTATGVDVTGTINTTDGYLMNGYNSFKFSANDSSSFAIGPHALQNWAETNSGWNNIAIGIRTLRDQTGNGSNIAIGADAQREATGFFNVAVGRFSLKTNTSNRNVAVGDYAAGEYTGQYGVAMGYSALYNGGSGARNTALGAFSMSAGSGDYNTATGYASLENVTTGGEYNVALGYFAGNDLTTGFRNTVVGSWALDGATTAQENTVIGSSAMGNSTIGTKNVAVGRSAGVDIVGDFNTVLGADAGTILTTGSNLTVVGYNAEPSSDSATNEITLGDTNVTTLRVPGAGFDVASGTGTFTGNVISATPTASNHLTTKAYVDAIDTHDSAAVQGQIDASISAIDTHDSAAVEGQINSKFADDATFSKDLTVDSDLTVSGNLAAGTVSGATVTATGTVSGATVTSTGDVNDSVSNVRTPRYTDHSGGDLTVSDEGVYRIRGAATLTTLTLGAPTAGSIICVYNNKTSSITLACGTTVTSMRKGTDNNSTHNATLTLGTKSLTTITIVASDVAVVTGTDVS